MKTRGIFPIYVRAPARGREFWTGMCRSKLYDLERKGLIKGVKIGGSKMFVLDSIIKLSEQSDERAI